MPLKNYVTIVSGVPSVAAAIQTTAGAADAGKIMATDGTTGKMDASFLPSGIDLNVENIVASEALSAGNFVNIWNNGGTRNVRKADASVNNKFAHGFVLAGFSSSATAVVYLNGSNTAVSGLTPGADIYLSATTAGLGTATAPAETSGFTLQKLGYASATNQIEFTFNVPIIFL